LYIYIYILGSGQVQLLAKRYSGVKKLPKRRRKECGRKRENKKERRSSSTRQ